jgi:hypothetical protein
LNLLSLTAVAGINGKRVTHLTKKLLDIEVFTGKDEWNGLISQNSQLIILG